ncbi:hypothetical protein YC2023_106387 [Brassica napus]
MKTSNKQFLCSPSIVNACNVIFNPIRQGIIIIITLLMIIIIMVFNTIITIIFIPVAIIFIIIPYIAFIIKFMKTTIIAKKINIITIVIVCERTTIFVLVYGVIIKRSTVFFKRAQNIKILGFFINKAITMDDKQEKDQTEEEEKKERVWWSWRIIEISQGEKKALVLKELFSR